MKNQKKKIVPKKLNKETKIAVESCNENSNLNKKNLSKQYLKKIKYLHYNI